MILALLPGGMSLEGLLIAIVIIAAAVGILFVACRAFGVPVPEWLVSILLIVLVCVVAIGAIRFIFTL